MNSTVKVVVTIIKLLVLAAFRFGRYSLLNLIDDF